MDLRAISANTAGLLALQPPGTRMIAVVKAGGYGHGAEPAARAALAGGAHMLAVATPAEAAELAPLAGSERVLVMGGLTPAAAAQAAEIGCALTCFSPEVAEAASSAGRKTPLHLKVDTGMGRFGCRPDEAAGLAELIGRLPGVWLAGTYTHFSSSESDPDRTRAQFELFRQVLDGLGTDPGLRHAANSGAAIRHPGMALDAIRTGIALYGCEWKAGRPAMSVRALVTHVKTLRPGESVGYGATWTATAASRLATAGIGYADGVHRLRSNTGQALVRGRRAPLVGRVSMDSIALDVTEVPGVGVGDAVTLIGSDGGDRITAEEVAQWSATISYEVLCAVGPRVVRVYQE